MSQQGVAASCSLALARHRWIEGPLSRLFELVHASFSDGSRQQLDFRTSYALIDSSGRAGRSYKSAWASVRAWWLWHREA